MAILKVARLGHPVLRKIAEPVAVKQIMSADTQRLIDDMVETMREYNGAGLAAPQVHTLQQICVIEAELARLAARHGDPDRLLAPVPPVRARVKVGRNDPCPCGSGRKYKHCCLDAK